MSKIDINKFELIELNRDEVRMTDGGSEVTNWLAYQCGRLAGGFMNLFENAGSAYNTAVKDRVIGRR